MNVNNISTLISDLIATGYEIYWYSICTRKRIRFSVNYTHPFVPCAYPLYLAFSSLRTCIFVLMCIRCSSHYHVVSGSLALIWTLPHSIPSYIGIFISKCKQTITLQLQLFYFAKIVVIKVYGFQVLDRNLIVLSKTFWYPIVFISKYTWICKELRFYDMIFYRSSKYIG